MSKQVLDKYFILKSVIYIIIFFLLNACHFFDTSKNIEALYIKDLNEKNDMLRYNITSRLYKQNKYRGYDMDFYITLQKRILDYFSISENELNLNNKTRQDIFIKYKKQVALINNYLDSIRIYCKKYFLKDDLNSIRINYVDSNSVFQANSDSLFKMLLLSNLTTQLNEVSSLCTAYGCMLGVYIENGNFHDFFIIQTRVKHNSICKLDIKNNFITKNISFDKLYISFKSLNKIIDNDTIKINTDIKMIKHKNQYTSNNFLLNKGRYIITFHVGFCFYDDSIKVGEINYDFEIK